MIRWLSLLCALSSVTWFASKSLEPPQRYLLLVLAPALLLVIPAWHHRRLLVPLGFRTAVYLALGEIGELPGPSGSHTLLWVTYHWSTSWAVHRLVDVAYAVWVTRLIVREVCGEDCRLHPFRILVCMAAGHYVMLQGAGLFLRGAPVRGVATLYSMAGFVLVWNLLSAPLLLLAARDGFRLRLRMPRWWLPVLAQMLLMGVVVYFDFAYSDSKTTISGSTTTTTTRSGTVAAHSVHAFWTGGYGDSCRWFTVLDRELRTDAAPLFGILMTLLFSALAVAVKVSVARRLEGTP